MENKNAAGNNGSAGNNEHQNRWPASRPHKYPPMPIEQRAKQFMPFAAVTGLDRALRKKALEMAGRDNVE
ncbi:MAG: hypothetical protein Q4A65_01060 [Bacillota bacterium]|nr:hypothetical protein [Bacillota bacterium]